MGARNWLRGQIVGWLRETPDDREPTWEDKGRLGRFGGWVRERRWFVATASFFLFGILGAAAPYVPELQAIQPFYPFAFALGIFLVGYLWGHGSALKMVQGIEQFIVYTGDSAAVFFGRSRTTSTGERAFEALASMGFRGFGKRYQSLRDRYARRDIERHKEKYSRFSEDGDETLRYRMPPHTVTVDGTSTDAEITGKVHIAHAGDLEDDLHSSETDVQASIPRTIDTKASNQISRYVDEKEETNRRITGRLSVLERELDALVTQKRSLTQDDYDRFMSEVEVILNLLNGRSGNEQDSQVNVDLSGVNRDAADRAGERLGNDE